MRGFLFLAFVSVTAAKCGLYWNYQHAESQKYLNYYHRGFGYGFGFQSFSTLVSCNDMEMFEQCKRAQKILDMWVGTGSGNQSIELGCARFIVCSADISENGKYWCQNMDSYDLCINAQTIIENANATSQYPIVCAQAVKLSDDIPVLPYREAHPITTTVPPNATTQIVTTTPIQGDSSGSILTPKWMLLLFIINLLN